MADRRDRTSDGAVRPPRRVWSPVLVLALIALAAAAIAGAVLVDRSTSDYQDKRFAYEAERVDRAITERMTAYAQVLRGGLGLFRASDEVTRSDWRRYVATLRLGRRYPGFKSLSWAPAVRGADLEEFLRRVRAEPAPPGLASPDVLREYRLRTPVGTPAADAPPGGELHSPILYVAPFSVVNQRVLGVDMFRDAARRAVMQRSVVLREPVLSPRLTLSANVGDGPGFIAYLAVVRDGRVRGWLTAAFLMRDFMRGLLADDPSALEVEIRDGEGPGGGALLYSSAGGDADGNPRPLSTGANRQRTNRVAVPGRSWTVTHVARSSFVSGGARAAPWLVLLGGVLALAFLLFAVRVAVRWRVQAEVLEEQAIGLREARAQAESATEAKATFLATMSHEIRTPMNAVIGMTDVLLASEMDADQRDRATIIRRSAEHLLHVINDVLDFSRLEAGKVDLEDEPFAVRDCARSAIDLVGGDAKAGGVELLDIVDDAVPVWVRGDANRLRQVLLNLLSNAVKFTAEGGSVRLAVTADVADGTAAVTFSVRDTGIGMDPEQAGRLFEAFEQADATTRRRFGGTGLGLSIAQLIVRAMNGVIDVESAVGEGSTFRFTVPLVVVPGVTPAPVDPPVAVRIADDHPLRVLVAEDSPVNQHVARHMLERLGYAPDVVGDGVAVLEALDRRDYDVVLLDVRMPRLDGEETAREIRRRRSEDRRPWLIAMTANVLAADRDSALAAGMDDFIPKPVTLAVLAAALRRVRPGTARPGAAP
jgi:signal transduction histidine kinase/ActR/RegA family two-component response regulator